MKNKSMVDNIVGNITKQMEEARIADRIEQLKDFINTCCIEAQKNIGSSDFRIWEDRRHEAENEIRELLNKYRKRDKRK